MLGEVRSLAADTHLRFLTRLPAAAQRVAPLAGHSSRLVLWRRTAAVRANVVGVRECERLVDQRARHPKKRVAAAGEFDAHEERKLLPVALYNKINRVTTDGTRIGLWIKLQYIDSVHRDRQLMISLFHT